MSLLSDLGAFSTEHRRCGDLDAGSSPDGLGVVRLRASTARRVDEDDCAVRD